MRNKRKIDDYISKAIEVLEQNQEVQKDGKIKKSFQSQLATFGVAVSSGSLISAVAFFSEQGESSVKRQELMALIYDLVLKQKEQIPSVPDPKKLLYYVQEKYKESKKHNDPRLYWKVRDDILNAAVALKLAMNFYELEK